MGAHSYHAHYTTEVITMFMNIPYLPEDSHAFHTREETTHLPGTPEAPSTAQAVEFTRSGEFTTSHLSAHPELVHLSGISPTTGAGQSFALFSRNIPDVIELLRTEYEDWLRQQG